MALQGLYEFFFGEWAHPQYTLIQSKSLCFIQRFFQLGIIGYAVWSIIDERLYEISHPSDGVVFFWGNPTGGYRVTFISVSFSDSHTAEQKKDT